MAGALDLSHGFWVLLATLSLMRTSAVAGRSVLVRAVAGTAVGALVTGVVLFLVGEDVVVYAWALPALMVVGLAAGPLFGVAAGQAGFSANHGSNRTRFPPGVLMRNVLCPYQVMASRCIDELTNLRIEGSVGH